MDPLKFRRHLDLLPKLLLAYGALLLASAIGVLLARALAPAGVAPFMQGYPLALTLLAMGAIAVWASVELGHRMLLGRSLALLLALPSLFLFPIGTVLGLYTVWVLMSPHAEDQYLARKRVSV
ncbi:MAG: hypothetical protein L0Y66_18800 [Myxococcaceae bacterium]|nr:hypothetical protein [Myxococcaceae bacterium]MCI0671399.1 hypothetical protein [Myxococcaceae bacterium]